MKQYSRSIVLHREGRVRPATPRNIKNVVNQSIVNDQPGREQPQEAEQTQRNQTKLRLETPL